MDEREARHGLIQWHGTTIIGVSKGGKTVKEFGIKIARGAGVSASSSKPASAAVADDDEPPF